MIQQNSEDLKMCFTGVSQIKHPSVNYQSFRYLPREMLLYKDEEHSSQNEGRQRPFSAEHELKRNKTEKFKQQTKGDKYYGDYQKQTQQDERRMHQN